MNTGTERWAAHTRMLFRVALGIFTVTALIGIFNSFHFLKLSRAVLLTHVHSGTLGWLTLCAFATGYWLFSTSKRPGEGHPRGVAVAMAIAVPLYVIGFFSDNFIAKVVFGTPVLLLVLGMIVLLLLHINDAGFTVPRFGVLMAFTTLLIGSTLGVLIQVQGAISHTFLPDGAIGGHASAQVGGYLVLFALSVIDWRLNGTDRMTVAGGIQVVLLFLSGVLLAAGVLTNNSNLLKPYVPLELIAVVIFVVRIAPRVFRARWMEASSQRHYAIAVPWILISLGFVIYVVSQLITHPGPPPFNVLLASDHAIFLGAMTNIFFGLIQDFTAERRDVMPWAENVIFYVLNIALAGFVYSLASNQQGLEKYFAPFQGLAVLLAIVVYSIRLSGGASPRAVTAPA